MLKSIAWDRYLILVVALAPTILLTAWGLDAYANRALHQQQCDLAVEWLEQSAEIAPTFTESGSMGRAGLWIMAQDELDFPSSASGLRWGIVDAAEYFQKYYPDRATDTPRALNPPNGLYERRITEGAEDLIEHCPETKPLIQPAFPMVFNKDDV